MIHRTSVMIAALWFAACDGAGGLPGGPAAAQPEPPAPEAKPLMPAFKPGMVVTDRTGARVGVVQAIAETPAGLNVVIAIDGKLVGVPPSTLRLRGDGAVSSQTKAEILATAGAPP